MSNDILFGNIQVVGWEHAVRGMRNPYDSWDKSDSEFEHYDDGFVDGYIGVKDLALMVKLIKAGPVHSKFMRMVVVYVDITAPLYWWKEFDTYKVGTVANSCSTMHTITSRYLTMDDFAHSHIMKGSTEDIVLQHVIDCINANIEQWKMADDEIKSGSAIDIEMLNGIKETAFNNIIQLLPSSFKQKRTIMMSYEVLRSIVKWRENHKLDIWSHDFMVWVSSLPYSELIFGDRTDKLTNDEVDELMAAANPNEYFKEYSEKTMPVVNLDKQEEQ